MDKAEHTPGYAIARKIKRHMRNGHMDRAIAVAEEALAQDMAGKDSVLCALSAVYMHTHRLDLAQQYAEQAITINPDDAALYNSLGNIALNRKDYAEAQRQVLIGLSKQPENESSYNMLGKIALAQKQFVKAKQCFEKTLSINADNDIAAISLGKIAFVEGDYPAVKKYFSAATFPKGDKPQNLIGTIALVVMDLAEGDIKAPVRHRVSMLSKNHADTDLNNMAEILKQLCQGKFSKAVEAVHEQLNKSNALSVLRTYKIMVEHGIGGLTEQGRYNGSLMGASRRGDISVDQAESLRCGPVKKLSRYGLLPDEAWKEIMEIFKGELREYITHPDKVNIVMPRGASAARG